MVSSSPADLDFRHHLVRLRGFSAGFGKQTVLREVSLDVPPAGIHALMGPAGGGKSTLLKTICGLNQRLASFWWRGGFELWGLDAASLSPEDLAAEVALLKQNARLTTASVAENAAAALALPSWSSKKINAVAQSVLEEWGLLRQLEHQLDQPAGSLPLGLQRSLGVVRQLAGKPRLLAIDEPLRDLTSKEAADLVELLNRASKTVSVFLVTHNLKFAKNVAHSVALLAGGSVVEQAPVQQFFKNPEHELTQHFVRFGNCPPTFASSAPHPEQIECRTVESPVAGEPTLDLIEQARQANKKGKKGFQWLWAEMLGGARRPGLFGDLSGDLETLKQLGCRLLISLTKEPLDELAIHQYGIKLHRSAIVDMDAPSLEQAHELCQLALSHIEKGEAVFFHCKGGLGRTGTLLACVLLHRSRQLSAAEALRLVRTITPLLVQSSAQELFLIRYRSFLNEGPAQIHSGQDRSGGK